MDRARASTISFSNYKTNCSIFGLNHLHVKRNLNRKINYITSPWDSLAGPKMLKRPDFEKRFSLIAREKKNFMHGYDVNEALRQNLKSIAHLS